MTRKLSHFVAMVALGTLAATAFADITVTDNSKWKDGDLLTFDMTTTVALKEVAVIESIHELVLKNPDEVEEMLLPRGKAIARTVTLLHMTQAVERRKEVKVKKGGTIRTRATTIINGTADVKEKIVFEE